MAGICGNIVLLAREEEVPRNMMRIFGYLTENKLILNVENSKIMDFSKVM